MLNLRKFRSFDLQREWLQWETTNCLPENLINCSCLIVRLVRQQKCSYLTAQAANLSDSTLLK